MRQVLYYKAKALEVAEFGRQISTAIDDAILALAPPDFKELAILSARIFHCNATQNNWVAEDLHTDDGECYNGHGRFWNCHSKLCPHCIAKQSRRVRKKLRLVIADQKLLVGENLHFLTLTMPNRGIGLLDARDIINRAWSLFRKKKWFTDKIVGGFKSEEFVLTKNGYHYHMHLIVRSKYIDYKLFRRCWTECLHAAVKDTPLTFQFNTSDQLAMANCQRITDVDDAIHEVAKYITKTSTWSQIPQTDLLDICRVRRFPRMFEFFGSFRIPAISDDTSLDAEEKDLTILDTKCLSDGEKPRSWRDEVHLIGAQEYFRILSINFENVIELRKQKLKDRYPYANFWQLPADAVRPKNYFLEKLRDFHIAYEESDRGKAETVARIAQNRKAA